MTKGNLVLAFSVLLILIIGMLQAQAQEVIPTYKIQIDKGWNLIYRFYNPSEQILPDSEVKSSDIKAIYGFVPTVQKYVEVYPNIQDDGNFNKYGIDDGYLADGGFWVYSDKSGFLSYTGLEEETPISNRQLYKGWNFVGISHEMLNTFVESGTCEIERMFYCERGQWDILTEDILSSVGMSYNKFNVADNEQDVGHVVLVKVGENCMLDLSSETINPPPIPN